MVETKKRQDPLVGIIYSSITQQSLSYEKLLNKMMDVQIIYLGENHDNPEHHRIQLQILTDLVKQGKKPIIGFEFFSMAQTGDLMSFANMDPHPKMPTYNLASEADLRKKLGWQDRDNQSWQFYFQFIDFAKKNKLTLFGADLPGSIVKRIVKTGIPDLTQLEKNLIHTTYFEDAEYKKLMCEKFKVAHCGFCNEKMSERMYQSWTARNDAMAYSIVSMLKDDINQPIVMILGSGHTEHNMAVYERVLFFKPEIKQLNLGLTEIAIKPTPLPAYLEKTIIDDRTFLPTHEYIWFTDRVSYDDPCDKFAALIKKMKMTAPAKD